MVAAGAWLDSPAWRTAEALSRVGHAVARELSGWRQSRPPSPGVARLLAAAAAGETPAGSSADKLAALRIALGADAYESAGHLAEPLIAGIDGLARAERVAALPLFVRWSLALGERERARSLASAHRAELELSDAGVVALELSGAASPRPILPSGRPNAMALDRLLAAEAIEPAEVRRLVTAAPWWLVADPQLYLLLANAELRADPAAAQRALQRFLRSQALPRCSRAARSAHFLADLHFAPAPRSDGPLVSVIVAAHRASETLGYAIDSLLCQSHANLEVLVGDDASDDGTAALLRLRYAREPRVRLFASTVNQGAYNLRNRLAERARGELLAFHDADDLALPVRIAQQVDRLTRARAAACHASWLRVTAAGRFVFFRDQAAVRLCLGSLLVPRVSFEALAGFRSARFGADLELRERLRQRYGEERVVVARKPLVLALWSDASATRKSGFEALEDGYRGPARRLYSELLFRARHLGADDAALEDALRASGNWAEPAPIVELV